MLPKEVTFTLEGEPLLALAPVPEPKPGDTPATPPPAFDAEFAGTFTLRMPTVGDSLMIDAQTHAFFERMGVKDPLSLPNSTYRLGNALSFFQVLATAKPAWCDANAAGGLTVLAICRAREVAEAAFLAAKKKPVATGPAL